MSSESVMWHSIEEDTFDMLTALIATPGLKTPTGETSLYVKVYQAVKELMTAQRGKVPSKEVVENIVRYCRNHLSEISDDTPSRENNEIAIALKNIQEFVYLRLVKHRLPLGTDWDAKVELLEEKLNAESRLYRAINYPDEVEYKMADLFDEILKELVTERSNGLSGEALVEHVSTYSHDLREMNKSGWSTDKTEERILAFATDLVDNFVQKIVYGIVL